MDTRGQLTLGKAPIAALALLLLAAAPARAQGDPIEPRLVRTIPIWMPSSFSERWPPVSQTAAEAPIPRPRPENVSTRTRGDICQRHGMRKVHYGRRWRCRR